MGTKFGTFPLGLTPDQEDRAARLHRDSLVIDVMHQGPAGYWIFTPEMVAQLKKVWADTNDANTAFIAALTMPARMAMAGELPAYEDAAYASGITVANIQDRGIVGQEMFRNTELDALQRIDKITSVQDIRRAHETGRVGWFLNYQMYPDVMDLHYVEWSRDQGVMMAGLTYNNPNMIGVGCTNPDSGVTAFGKQVIAVMNDVGMLVDVSHAGPQTTLDACRLSSKPVIASHTGVEALFKHPRNKSDDEHRAIAETGGMIGVYAAPDLMTRDPNATVELVADHIDHLVELVGVDHVGLGTDWPLQAPKWVLDGPFRTWLKEKGFADDDVPSPAFNLAGFDDYQDYPNITRLLVARGYDDDQIRKILGLNALRVFEDVWV